MSKATGTNPQLYPEHVIRTGGYNVTCLTFLHPQHDETSNILLTGTECGKIHAWNLRSQAIIQTVLYEGDNSSLLSIHCLRVGEGATSRVGVLSYNRRQCVRYHTWSESRLSTLLCELKLSTLCPTFCRLDCLWMDSIGCYIISAPNDKTVQFYQLSGIRKDENVALEPKLTKLGTDCIGMVTCMKLYNSDTNCGAASLLIGSECGSVYLYTSSDGKEDFRLISSLNTHSTNPVVSLDYNTDCHLGCSAGAGSGTVSVWKIEDNSSIKHWLNISTPSKGFNQLSLRSDCKLIISCGWDGVIRLHAPKKGSLLALMDFHRDGVNCAVFNNDFSFVTSSKDGTLCLWNLYAKNKA